MPDEHAKYFGTELKDGDNDFADFRLFKADYDAANDAVVLNLHKSEEGDGTPGVWVYRPETNAWDDIRLGTVGRAAPGVDHAAVRKAISSTALPPSSSRMKAQGAFSSPSIVNDVPVIGASFAGEKSMTATSGFSDWIVPWIFSRLISASTWTCRASTPSLRARSAICCADSSPLT